MSIQSKLSKITISISFIIMSIHLVTKVYAESKQDLVIPSQELSNFKTQLTYSEKPSIDLITEEVEQRALYLSQEREKALREEKTAFESSFVELVPYSICDTKSYMDLNMIEDVTSKQWKLKSSYQLDEKGHYYYQDGYAKYYVIAIGSYYGEVGDMFKITLESENTFFAIVGDQKSDKDMFEGKYHLSDGSTIEFIVDESIVRNQYPNFTGGFQKYTMWSGNIKSISKRVR